MKRMILVFASMLALAACGTPPPDHPVVEQYSPASITIFGADYDAIFFSGHVQKQAIMEVASAHCARYGKEARKISEHPRGRGGSVLGYASVYDCVSP